MHTADIAQEVESNLVDAEALVRALTVLDQAAQSDKDIINAYPLIHDLLADKIAGAFSAINPVIARD